MQMHAHLCGKPGVSNKDSSGTFLCSVPALHTVVTSSCSFFLNVEELAPSQLLAESTQTAEEFISAMQTSCLVDGDASFDWITTVKIVLFAGSSHKVRLASPWVTSLCLWTDLTIAGRWKNVGQAEAEIAIETIYFCPRAEGADTVRLLSISLSSFPAFLQIKISLARTKPKQTTLQSTGLAIITKAIPFFKSVACGGWHLSPETSETNQKLGHRARWERE